MELLKPCVRLTEHTVVCGGSEGCDLFGPSAVPRADLDQDGVIVEEAGVLEAGAVVVQQRHRVLVLNFQRQKYQIQTRTSCGHFGHLMIKIASSNNV